MTSVKSARPRMVWARSKGGNTAGDSRRGPCSLAYRQAGPGSIPVGRHGRRPPRKRAKMTHSPSPVAVLVSGGVDSAVLLAEALRGPGPVHPLYLRCGLRWETVELEHLRRFLGAIAGPRLASLTVLEMPVADLYGTHWSITGHDIPDADSPDEAVYLPGRNVLFLAKAMIWCHLHKVPALQLGILGANPFADATPAFFAAYQTAVNQAIGGAVEVRRPFAGL